MPKKINGVIIKTYKNKKPIIFLARIKDNRISSENIQSIIDRDGCFNWLGVEDIVLVNYKCGIEREGMPLTIENVKKVNIFTENFHSLFKDPSWFERRINEIIHVELENESVECSVFTSKCS